MKRTISEQFVALVLHAIYILSEIIQTRLIVHKLSIFRVKRRARKYVT